ncbi:type II toxin-antitoxin system death-on-curing family toxin [Pseudoalteromonas phenolica]|uniref:Type II toxin-antitoxin system death-on-curing family toxin n=1 Tax=Pseudoalteromonas phenolica TaxID=161398 RepID=A0A4Q7IS66_9GAMM|nr:type II toxin-antitoxin system death-on-curing family toxin [Pseudoalteromonas phenolica]RZQ54841.1 type II toxin-antitoxin system death-on-curing family toxin [Pseudoalteromonas phenolica]
MDTLIFPAERVIEINAYIQATEPGFIGRNDIGKLQGALARIDNAICYEGLDDVFEIAAKYAHSIAVAHAFSDANKRTGFITCLEYLSINDFEIKIDNDMLADAMVDLVLGELGIGQFADLLYSSYIASSEV